MRKIQWYLIGVAIAPMTMAICSPALAQTEAGTAAGDKDRDTSILNEDIVVSAQRRDQNVQKVPISITAVSGVQLEAMNIQDAQRIVDIVPNFKAGGLGGPSGPPFFNIRGISFIDFSNINEASVALYIDDVYQVAQGTGTSQVFDLERVEVLRGPQGTLFGRNSTAGVVHYITRKPSDTFDADISAQYGSFNQLILQAAAGGPLTEGLRARFAVKYNRDDGSQLDVASGQRFAMTDAIAARAIIEADISSAATFEGKISYSHNGGQSPIHRPYFVLDPNNPSGYCGGRPVPGTAADLAHAACVLGNGGVSRTAGRAFDNYTATRGTSDVDDWPFRYTSWGGYAKLTADLGFADLLSITGYEHYRQFFAYDADGFDNRPYGGSGSRDLGVFFWANSETVSQELRLSGTTAGNIRWLVGGYYYDADQHADFTISVDTVKTDLIGYTTHTRSYAGFGQVDVPLGDKVTLTGGLRYTDDTRVLDPLDCSRSITSTTCAPTTVPRIADGQWTYRLAGEFRPSDDVLFYAAFSHGFKSGGFNINRDPLRRGPVGSEVIDNYEVGLKSKLFDNRVTFNGAAFYYKYHGIQALIGTIDPLTGASSVLYINAGDPRTYGAEAELSASLTDNLELRMGLGYLDTKVIADPAFTADGRVLNGNRLPQAPKFSGNVIIRYNIPLGESGTVTVQGDGRYQTDIYSGIDNDPAELVAGYGVANARIGWKSANRTYTIEAFVDNLFDKQIIQQSVHNTLGSFPITVTANGPLFDSGFGVWGRPRTWGIRAGYSF